MTTEIGVGVEVLVPDGREAMVATAGGSDDRWVVQFANGPDEEFDAAQLTVSP